ncbi:MAG TPA: penicillin-binding protein 1C, partial [Acetobacteraceae bacterium]|nr:penicillin-binding protein 1C [Acetobacteraceae bacterium]
LGHDGTPVAFYPDARGEWKFATHPNTVDPLLVRMLIAIEDHRFYRDPGFDPLAIVRAGAQLLIAGHVVSGASTLTMQIARLLHPAPRTLPVKLREAMQALSLTEHYSKQRIMGMWLSLAPFGGNIVGVQAASERWFGKPPRSLSPAQAALLIALCRRPEALRPDRHPEAARIARNRVLAQAAIDGVISPEEAARAAAEPVPTRWQALPRQSPQATLRLADGTRTTLDAPLNAALARLASQIVTTLHARESLAILIVDARTRAIRAAYLGDFADPARAGFVDLSRAVRSPGSALKPFLYGLAFADGLAGPDTRLRDLPRDFAGYGPDDFTHQFMGTVTAAAALRRSLNLPAVALMQRLGPARFTASLAAAGVPLQLPSGAAPSLPIALGGAGISMRQLVALYAGLATDGRVAPLHLLAGVRHRSAALLSLPVAQEIADILTRPLPGETATGIAWKTGTSAGNRDDWAVGFDRRHVVAVWIGRPDGGALPGGAAVDRAVPVLAQAFGLLRIRPRQAAPPARPLSLAMAPAGTPLALAAPPPQATLTTRVPIRLRVIGGVRPLTFLIDGVKLDSIPALRSTSFQPPGPGFYRLRVIDGDGQSIESRLRVVGAPHG